MILGDYLKIKDIAIAKSGMVLSRKRAEKFEKPVEKYKVLTLKSISKYGNINHNDLEEYNSSEKLSDNYITREGDIVIRLREPVLASYIGKEDENILVPSYFLKIRVLSDKILPQYLVYYINSKNVQQKLKRYIAGTSIPMIKPSVIRDLDVPTVPLDRQRAIIKLLDCGQKELTLLNSLIELREKYYKGICDKLMESDVNE
jgi:restriction endonuclease S subunit